MWLELAFAIGFLLWKKQTDYSEKPMASLDYHPLYGQPGKVDKLQGHRLESRWPQRSHPEISRFEPESIVNTPGYVERYVNNKYDVIFNEKNIFLDDSMVDVSQKPKSRQIFGYIPQP